MRNIYPVIEVDVEIVKSDVSSSDENLFNEGIHALKNSEIEHFSVLVIEIGRQFSRISHFEEA